MTGPAAAESTGESPCRSRPAWWNATGLEVIVIALLWLALFARSTGARLIREEYWTLGAAVWCACMASRLVDGLSQGGPRAPRHVLAARWKWPLIALIVCVAAAALWVGLHRPRRIVLDAGLRLGAAIAAFLSLTWLSRQRWPGQTGAVSLGGLIVIGLIQSALQNDRGATFDVRLLHAWRAVFAGFFITVFYLGLSRAPGASMWLLPARATAGYLFALGVAAAPFAHFVKVPEMFSQSSVVIFAAVCSLYLLGLRLWDADRSSPEEFERRLLTRLYPAIGLTTAAGAAIEFGPADHLSRPLFGAAFSSALLLSGLHLLRARLPAGILHLLAGAGLALCAAVALAAG